MPMRLKFILKLTLLALVSLFVLAACDSASPEEETITGEPIVLLASPRDGNIYQAGTDVQILARVENAGDDIASVVIKLDGQVLGEVVQPNTGGEYAFTVRNGWIASGNGSHTLTAEASRFDGTFGISDVVTIEVVGDVEPEPTIATLTDAGDAASDDSDDGDGQAQTVASSTPTRTVVDITPIVTAQTIVTTAPTQILASVTPSPIPASPTPSVPTGTVRSGANLRSGPGTNFPVAGSLAAGETVNLQATNLNRTWYRVSYYNGSAWIFGQLLDTSGNVAALPAEAGPPTPIPPTNTPAVTATPQPTATTQSNVDLVITSASIDPFPLVCNQSSEIRVVVTNNGTAATSANSVVRVQDFYNGAQTQVTTGPIPILQPAQSTTVVMYITVSTNFSESHVLRTTIDPDNTVAETNESNNVAEDGYILAPGGC